MRRDSSHSHAQELAYLAVFLCLPLLGGCGEVCGLIALIALALPVLAVLERRFRGLSFVLVGLALLASPLALWDQVEDGPFEQFGAQLALWTAALGHDLVAALLPRWAVQPRLMVGAVVAGGWLGASVGLFGALRRTGRPVAGLLVGASYAALGLWLLQQGPSPREFAPGGLDWPALDPPLRQQPVVPLRPATRQVSAGKLRFFAMPPYLTERVSRAELPRGSCTVRTRSSVLAGPPVDAGLWRAVSGEAAPGCGAQCPPTTPVSGLSWLQALDFANRASAAWGLVPAYSIEGQKVSWKLNVSGFRLPTEAEWELLAALGQAGEGPEWTWDEFGEAACGDDAAFTAAKSGVILVSKPKNRVLRAGGAPRAGVAASEKAAGLRLVR